MTISGRTYQSQIDVPDGFDVFGLPTLLDTNLVQQRLNSCLPSDATHFDTCKISNLRRKTRTNCTICYELTRASESAPSNEFVYIRAFSKSEYSDAERRAQQSRWAMTVENLSITPLRDLCAIVYWFPNDERLDGLRRIVVPKKLQRLFYEHLTEYPLADWRISDRSIRLRLIRYKPERRAILRCRFRAHRNDKTDSHERFVYLGLYEGERVAEQARTLEHLGRLSEGSKEWTTAPLLGVDEANAMMIWGELPGPTLRSELASGISLDGLALCARAISDVHACDGSSLPLRDSVGIQNASVRAFLSDLLPEHVTLIGDVSERLERSMAQMQRGCSNVVHGDLHPGQIILGNERMGLIDFDRCHSGDPLEDIGNLCAQLWLGPPDGVRYDPEVVFSSFLDAYAERREFSPRQLDMWTAFSLFRSAVVPLGRFQTDWRNRTWQILQEAERFLT